MTKKEKGQKVKLVQGTREKKLTFEVRWEMLQRYKTLRPEGSD